jgi:pSer/pThr/pTyr-binding forkhead associated (FHA) protein
MDRANGVPRASRGSEVKMILEAERAGHPFLVYRDGGDTLFVRSLDSPRLIVGRLGSSEIVIDWDDQVSRVHALLEIVGDRWTVSDDGLSRNGTFVGGARVTGRKVLANGDVLMFGETFSVFCDPKEDVLLASTIAAPGRERPELTSAQRKVLVALCRPALESVGSPFAAATNREIANELYLSLDAVKGHMRILFARFEVTDLPQNQKRAALVDRALLTGSVSVSSLDAYRAK